MERVAGWYKRYAQVIIFVLGLVVAGLMNADTVSMAWNLSTDDALRSATLQSCGMVRDAQSCSLALDPMDRIGSYHPSYERQVVAPG